MKGWQLVPVEPTEEMIRAAYDSGCVDYLTDRSKVIKLFNVMHAAAPTPPAQEAEPVAWMYGSQIFNGNRCWEGYEDKVTWLYTSPPSDKLRQAAREIYDHIDILVDKSTRHMMHEEMENLRAALEGKS